MKSFSSSLGDPWKICFVFKHLLRRTKVIRILYQYLREGGWKELKRRLIFSGISVVLKYLTNDLYQRNGRRDDPLVLPETETLGSNSTGAEMGADFCLLMDFHF